MEGFILIEKRGWNCASLRTIAQDYYIKWFLSFNKKFLREAIYKIMYVSTELHAG